MSFTARYRIGNGAAGNIGRDTIGHILTDVPGIEIVRNPLAAAGGVDPESIVSIRQRAPFAFRTQFRAVTEDDYAAVAILDPAIAEARGTLRWTGSWYTAFISIDTASVAAPSPGLIHDTKKRLNLFRMTGTDFAIEGAIIVGLRITLNVCVDPTHFRSEVSDALMHLFITGDQCSGQSGLLNSQHFTFGETIYASPLIAAAQAVEGVTSVTLATFSRMDDPSIDGTSTGFLVMRRLEIARCDNDPNRLDHGLFALAMDGGK
nr:baseplate J/gp47 family protein [Granulicella sp. dw_53]